MFCNLNEQVKLMDSVVVIISLVLCVAAKLEGHWSSSSSWKIVTEQQNTRKVREEANAFAQCYAIDRCVFVCTSE